MTFFDIFSYTAFAGAILSILFFVYGFISKKYFNPSYNNSTTLLDVAVLFVKNWIGALFIFSGAVKAIDPIGTGIKIKEYFEALHLNFLESLSLEFSVFMIVLEIVLGVALIIGWMPFITTGISYLMMIFFTFLTGFTYISAYCPSMLFYVLCAIVLLIITISAFLKDSKKRMLGIAATLLGALAVFLFCKFSGQCLLCAFDKANMKVTSCGCFGDFIKLEPLQSFNKDLILIALLIFLLFNIQNIKAAFQNKTGKIVSHILIAIITIATWIFCLYNYKWSEPIVDFRAYKIGTNIIEDRKTKKAPVMDYEFKYINKNTKKVSVYTMKQLSTAGLSDADSFISRVDKIVDPGIPAKIIDFNIYDKSGGTEVTDDLLLDPAYTFYIVAYDIKHTNIEAFTKKINPLVKAANSNACNCILLSSNATPNDIKALQTEAYLYWSDEVMLKTMGRGNPVILLVKDGVILNKWHWNKLPNWDAVKAAHIK